MGKVKDSLIKYKRFVLLRRITAVCIHPLKKNDSSQIKLEERAPKFESREIQFGLFIIDISIPIPIAIPISAKPPPRVLLKQFGR